jgi:hypothetical protein
MTHFGVIVGILTGVTGLLSGILGLVWRMSARWQAMQDLVTGMHGKMLDIIAEKSKDHDNFDERLKYLERRDKR